MKKKISSSCIDFCTVCLLVILLGSGIGRNSFAQVKGGQHTKLFDLYALEKFEDCAFKAENMVLSEKYKKDPEPLLYLSMCMFKISRMDSSALDQHYKEPLKESLKYAKKFRAKDKDGAMYNANINYFFEIKEAGIAHANYLYNLNQYAKASAFFGMVNAFEEKDNNVRFMKGVCDILAKNAADGAKTINDAMKGLAALRKDSSYKADNISDPLLVDAMIIYSDYLNKNKKEDSAKKTISFAQLYFPENIDIRNQYNLLHGIDSKVDPKESSIIKPETEYELHNPDFKDTIQFQDEKILPYDSSKQENREEKSEPPENNTAPDSIAPSPEKNHR